MHSGGSVGLVLNCTEEVLTKILGVPMIQLGLAPGSEAPAEKIRYATRIVKQFFEMDFTREVLVCCSSTRSRAPAIVLAYLLAIGMTFEEAYGLIRTRHSRVEISSQLLKSVLVSFGKNPAAGEDHNGHKET